MPIRRVAVLTSGGDAAGMNAAIRAVVRTGVQYGWEMIGVRHGFRGIVDDDLKVLGARSVGGILEYGGTCLHTSRFPAFLEEQTQRKTIEKLEEHGIDGLIVIGGNGSQHGSHALSVLGFPVIGIASTIDNDLYGTDLSIGADTALDVALESIDKLRTTATSHDRAFIVEVMGRECGYLALMAGLAGGAESIVIPEVPLDPETVARQIWTAHERGKTHALVVVAEGAAYDAPALAQYFVDRHEQLGFEPRVTRLGHVQRGGVPTATDRLLATRLGASATEFLQSGLHGVLVGMVNNQTRATPLSDIVKHKKELDISLLELARVLAQ